MGYLGDEDVSFNKMSGHAPLNHEERKGCFKQPTFERILVGQYQQCLCVFALLAMGGQAIHPKLMDRSE